MKKIIGFICCALCALASVASAASLYDTSSAVPKRMEAFDDALIMQGLKETLMAGSEKAVRQVSRTDGYYGNQMVRIFMPGELQDTLMMIRSLGSGRLVDELELSMNRAAESAAQRAAYIFSSAIQQLAFDNARQIAHGGGAAATRYFESKSRRQLFEAYKPVIKADMERAYTTQRYNTFLAFCGRVSQSPQSCKSLGDIENYLTNRALDGILLILAEEEKKIRTNPAAQTTPAMRKAFGGR